MAAISTEKSVNGGKVHEAIGLMRRVGPIFGWFDNCELLVCTPNGRRETHAMAIEFQQHLSDVLECGSAHGRRSVGDVGDASPHFPERGGQHTNCPPHFSVQKICEAYSLTQHSSLLRAAT